MSPSISPDDLQFLQHEAEVAARSLRHKYRLSSDYLADLRQDLLLDLIGRYPSFDPARGSLGAFVGTIIAHRAADVGRMIWRERRLHGVAPVSLDAAVPGCDGASRVDLIAENDGLMAFHGQTTDRVAEVDLRLDIERGLGSLSPDDSALCVALVRNTVDQLAAAGRGARSSLYRRVKEIRLRLIAAGLQAA